MGHRSSWSIGARLTLWYSLVLLAGLALFGAGIWLVVAHSLMAAVDERLASQAKGVATVLQNDYKPAKPQHLQEELAEYSRATPEGRLIEVWGLRGEVLLGARQRYRDYAIEFWLLHRSREPN
jgi:hypothetical protein